MKVATTIYRTSFFVLLMSMPLVASAQITLAPLFSEGAIVQRHIELPVWGYASPGTEVTVQLDEMSGTATADESGRWQVVLPPQAEGGPFELIVSTADEVITVGDIWFGDVWLASGQSNMEWTVNDVLDSENVIASADNPLIRQFRVDQAWSYEPVDELPGGHWAKALPDEVAGFSGVGYFFLKELYEQLRIPLGLIHTSWGGSRIEPWMSAEALGLDEAGMQAVRDEEDRRREVVLAALLEKIGDLPESDPGLVDGNPVWAAVDLDDSDWDLLPVPSQWEAAGYPGLDGIGWYRTTFELTAEEAATGIVLGLGMIDDSDITWLNGQEIGRFDLGWNVARRYEVSPEVLQVGTNVLAVRVEDFQGGGGIAGSEDTVYLETANGERRPLASQWRFKVGSVTTLGEGDKNQVPTLLYNAMVHPILPYPITGVIWYQGESNADTMEDAEAYGDLFIRMIQDWRRIWDHPELPFFWVQLANYMAPDVHPAHHPWPVLREAQTSALVLPKTGQAIAMDVGEADDIHPRDKQSVGKRLALNALAIVYQQHVQYSGPVLEKTEVAGSRIILTFTETADGLVAPDNAPGGFAIAGEDREFVWAEARIEGPTVIVWSEDVPTPVAVRYAWGNNPENANLRNSAGLPAGPFRTDSW